MATFMMVGKYSSRALQEMSIQRTGNVDTSEMRRVFNMGIGLVMVVSPFYAESIRHQLRDQKIDSWLIGEIIDQPQGVSWK